MKVIKHYRLRTGSAAFVLHRLSGLGLMAYLPLHIYVTGTLTGGPESFNRTMAFVDTPLFHFLEWGLFGVILYHAFNGLRLILADFGVWDDLAGQKRMFWVAVAVGGAAWLASFPVLLGLL